MILNVVNKASAGGSNQIIVYESPGSNGGFTMNTGRNNKKVVLTGRLTSGLQKSVTNTLIFNIITETNNRELLNNLVTKIEDLRDRGEIVELLMPINGNNVSKWTIEIFSWDIPEGSSAYVDFAMELIEYRQVNYNKTIINLIGGDVIRKMQERIIERSAT